MSILVALDGENISLSQDQEKLIREIVDRDFYFVEKDFTDICNKKSSYSFCIKAYQRGYRWTEVEITQLLNDILEISNEKYCLQPLIVKQTEVESTKEGSIDSYQTYYEVIDGQQRLTTMRLILQYLHKKEFALDFTEYKIDYETLRTIDNQYIEDAESTIENWFEANNTINLNDFAEKIKKLFFVWYEIIDKTNIDEKNSNKIFKTINDNQIALTNAELFKALLLNPENILVYSPEEREKISQDINQIAFEWDRLEQDLHNNEFWSFICNTSCDDRMHLDYLFELFAACKIDKITNDKPSRNKNYKNCKNELAKIESKAKKLNRDINRYSFTAVQLYLEYLKLIKNTPLFANIKLVWKEIKECYDKLYTWYSDYDLFHYIGYLGAVSEKRQTSSIVPDIILEFYKKNANEELGEVRQNAKAKIFEILKSHINYEDNSQKPKSIYVKKHSEKALNHEYFTNMGSKKIGEFLLFFNIWTTTNQKSLKARFPFYNHKFSSTSTEKEISWDIEHINARQFKIDLSKETNFNYKQFAKWALEEIAGEKLGDSFLNLLYDATESELNSEQLEQFKKEWKDFASNHNQNESGDNSIQNLALLDSTTNRSYGNSFFGEKRAKIIENDKNGKYVPIATKNVFLKYYNSSPKFDGAWDDSDKKAYMKEIDACIEVLTSFGEV